MTKKIFFQSSIGLLEGIISESVDKNSATQKSPPCAIVLHPNPLHGGDMNSKIVHLLYKTFEEQKFNVLKFNFRGVGRSKGSLDDFRKNPEATGISDAIAALDWMHQEYPKAPYYWIIGFSFGALIAMHVAMRRPEIENFLCICPDIKDFNFLNPCPCPGMIITAEFDNIVDPKDTKLYQFLDKQGNHQIEYSMIANSDHFFVNVKDPKKNNLYDLYEVVLKYVTNVLATRITNPIRKKRRRRKKRELQDD